MLAVLRYGNLFYGLEVLKEAQQGGPEQLSGSVNRIKQTECKFMRTESVSKVLPVQISKRDRSCERRFASVAVVCLTVLPRPPTFPVGTACLGLKSAIYASGYHNPRNGNSGLKTSGPRSWHNPVMKKFVC